MTLYRITAPSFAAALVVGNDVVMQTAPVLSWTIGRPFIEVRDYCRARGWIVEPLPDAIRPSWFEYDGSTYELHWRNDVLDRITLHEPGEDSRDLRYDELPDVLKEQL